MHFVYILETTDQQHWYIGVTNDLSRRLAEHNDGKSIHTNQFSDWELKTYIAFRNRERAQAFEHYLKSHSGRSFSKKHL